MKLFMIFICACINVSSVFICIAFRGNVMSLITFDKIYLFSRTKTPLLPGRFETKRKPKRHFEIKKKIRRCTTWCQFVLRNIIKLKLSFKKRRQAIPIYPISIITYIQENAKKKEMPKIVIFQPLLKSCLNFKTVILI